MQGARRRGPATTRGAPRGGAGRRSLDPRSHARTGALRFRVVGPIRTLTVALLAASLLAAFTQPARADDSNATLPARADVGPMRHLWQSLNNCGPASVVMALSTFGIEADQEEARLALPGPGGPRRIGPR